MSGRIRTLAVPEPLDDVGRHALEQFGAARRRDEGRQTDRRASELDVEHHERDRED